MNRLARAAATQVYRLWLLLKDRQNGLWVTPALAGLLAVALAFSANAIGATFSGKLPDLDPETIDKLLEVMAASMLAIAIFCLATLVSALSSSSMTATPRATELLMGDPGARSSIGSFVAAFIFAIVARTALGMGYYDAGGRVVLFVCTMLVVTVVVLRLLFWIRAGSTLGRMRDTMTRIADVTRRALHAQACRPWMGAQQAPPEPTGSPLIADSTGYLTAINMAGLQRLAMQGDLRIHIRLRPGTYVDPTTELARIEGEPAEPCFAELRDCFVLASSRTYDQDARFGLIVLGEVAVRALSPSVNDPGTAIGVISTMAGLLITHAREVADPEQREDAAFDRLTAPACDDAELVSDAFLPIARDGARMIEVAIRTQKMLAAIKRNAVGGMADTAGAQARDALQRALVALTHEPDQTRLKQLHARLFD